MQCEKPITLFKNLDRQKYPDGLSVPCGKCLLCRMAKRREWSTRMLHELTYWEDSIFLTLTYDNEHLPLNPLGMPLNYNGSLKKSDLQKFIKRIRKRIEPNKIKYFACGEYGDKEERPHYHLIIFGLSILDDELIMSCWPFCDWTNKAIAENSMGLAEADSIRYVAQYIDKKYSGELENEHYWNKGRDPVFRIGSCGLGKSYMLDNAEQMISNSYVSVNGVKQSLPRYYMKKLNISSDELSDKAIKSESKLVKKFTGHEMPEIDFYKRSMSEDYRRYDEHIKAYRNQKARNLRAKTSLKKTRDLN